MKLFKKYFSIFLAAMLMMSFVPLGTSAASSLDFTMSGSTIVKCSTSASGELIIPENQLGSGAAITAIGKEAFKDCTKLTSVTIPKTVTSIGEGAFTGCLSLEKVTINSEITEIKSRTFKGCENLKAVNIPGSVKSIGANAFEGCALTSVSIPSSVERIEENAFAGCKSIERFTVDSTNKAYKNDGSGALISADGKELLQFPAASAAESYSIPGGVEIIDELAFAKNKNIKSVVCPSTLKEIKPYAFSECSALSEITFNDGLETIGSCAFQLCPELHCVTLPGSLQNFESAFFNSGLETVVMKSGISSISEKAFDHCSSLSTVTIPQSVTSIKQGAFADCTSLLNINIPVETTSIDKNAFFNIKNNVTIHAEDGSPAVDYAKANSIKYVTDVYRLTFDADGGRFADGSSSISYAFKSGESISISGLESPQKEGFTFSSWSNIPSKMGNSPITVKAKWNVNSYDLTLVINGVSTTKSVAYGEAVNVSAPPADEGFVFEGWSPALPSTMPAGNVKVTAMFKSATEAAGTKLPVSATKSADYKTDVTVNVTVHNVPKGYYVVIDGGEEKLSAGGDVTVSSHLGSLKENKTFSVKVLNANKTEKGVESLTQKYTVEVNNGIFAKIASFFTNWLFNLFKWKSVNVDFT